MRINLTYFEINLIFFICLQFLGMVREQAPMTLDLRAIGGKLQVSKKLTSIKANSFRIMASMQVL